MSIEFNKPSHERSSDKHEGPDVGNFADLFDKFNEKNEKKEKTVVKGVVTSIDREAVNVDIGIKDEGRIPLKEFVQSGKVQEVNVGDEIEVYIQSYENRYGRLILSREKAVKEVGWRSLKDALKNKAPVSGIIVGRVKGGLMVDLSGIIAFLPGSQVDVKPIKDISPLIGIEQPFVVLQVDDEQGNVIVSRKAILEESRKGERQELLSQIKVGQVLEGTVKNITDYGAFVDLGNNIDALLHMTDMSWDRIAHPSELLSIGQRIQVKIIKYDEETHRISLGTKQLEKNPWSNLMEKYPVGMKTKGKVTNIVDYGMFVKLESGVEGLVHISELSWTKPNVHPNKLFAVEQEVEVVVLDFDVDKHRISLGIKQCKDSIWKKVEEKYPVSTVVEGTVTGILKTGLVVSFEKDIEGIVHSTDISWTLPPKKALQSYKVGDAAKAAVLSIEPEKGRINLGIKHLEADPFEEAFKNIKRGGIVTCEVASVANTGLTVKIGKGVEAFIAKSDLSSDRLEQRPDRFSVGDRVDVKVVRLDKINRDVGVSIKALEIEEQKQKISEYGSISSGASLGDILGKAINLPGQAEKPAKETRPKLKAKKKSSATASEKGAEINSEEAAKEKKKEKKADETIEKKPASASEKEKSAKKEHKK